ncbi:OmpA family protein [Actinomyces wuliandei]|nr:OmpA family protein [Actinomyces wuliandei]
MVRLVRRRSLLLVPVLAGAGAVVGCSGSGGSGGSSQGASGGSSAGASGSSSGGASAPVGVQEVETRMAGHRVTVGVSPVVRVSEEASVVVLEVTRAEDDIHVEHRSDSDDDVLWVSNLLSDRIANPTGAVATRLADLDGGRVWVPTQDGRGDAIMLAPGESGTAYVPFGVMDVDSAWVFVPMTGFILVQVVDREQAAGVGVDLEAVEAALEDMGTDSSLAGPVALGTFTRALDESSSTLTTDEEVVVTLASDVTFESDSAELSDEAGAQLEVVAGQVGRYPDGGSLVIVGHTDDVDEEDYNQGLSEERAQAVSDRLGELVDLGSWEVAVEGKGESEPAVEGTDDEARAANRRVEITLTPTKGTTRGGQGGPAASASPSASAVPSASAAPSASASGSGSGGLPEAYGPVGPGPEGVTVTGRQGDGELSVVLERVTRAGGFLLGELEVTAGPGGTGNDGSTFLGAWLGDERAKALSNPRGEGAGVDGIVTSSGLTLLSGGERVFPADYLPPGKDRHIPLTERKLSSVMKEGMVTRVCVAWPDTGQDTVVLDHESRTERGDYAFRLTDVPVVEA